MLHLILSTVLISTIITGTAAPAKSAVTCQVPHIANGTRLSNVLRWNETVRFSCHAGFHEGGLSARCDADGNLTQTPTCNANPRTLPMVVANNASLTGSHTDPETTPLTTTHSSTTIAPSVTPALTSPPEQTSNNRSTVDDDASVDSLPAVNSTETDMHKLDNNTNNDIWIEPSGNGSVAATNTSLLGTDNNTESTGSGFNTINWMWTSTAASINMYTNEPDMGLADAGVGPAGDNGQGDYWWLVAGVLACLVLAVGLFLFLVPRRRPEGQISPCESTCSKPSMSYSSSNSSIRIRGHRMSASNMSGTQPYRCAVDSYSDRGSLGKHGSLSRKASAEFRLERGWSSHSRVAPAYMKRRSLHEDCSSRRRPFCKTRSFDQYGVNQYNGAANTASNCADRPRKHVITRRSAGNASSTRSLMTQLSSNASSLRTTISHLVDEPYTLPGNQAINPSAMKARKMLARQAVDGAMSDCIRPTDLSLKPTVRERLERLEMISQHSYSDSGNGDLDSQPMSVTSFPESPRHLDSDNLASPTYSNFLKTQAHRDKRRPSIAPDAVDRLDNDESIADNLSTILGNDQSINESFPRVEASLRNSPLLDTDDLIITDSGHMFQSTCTIADSTSPGGVPRESVGFVSLLPESPEKQQAALDSNERPRIYCVVPEFSTTGSLEDPEEHYRLLPSARNSIEIEIPHKPVKPAKQMSHQCNIDECADAELGSPENVPTPLPSDPSSYKSVQSKSKLSQDTTVPSMSLMARLNPSSRRHSPSLDAGVTQQLLTPAPHSSDPDSVRTFLAYDLESPRPESTLLPSDERAKSCITGRRLRDLITTTEKGRLVTRKADSPARKGRSLSLHAIGMYVTTRPDIDGELGTKKTHSVT
eukprot:scpid31249/ scgid25000/ 